MKKIILFMAIALFIVSCSGDDNGTTNPTDTVLLKKLISTDENGNTVTYDYTYDGNKFVSKIGTDGSSLIYNYTGNYITYTKSEDAVQTTETFYEYDNNGKIQSSNMFFQHSEEILLNYTSIRTYTYNDDGTLSIHDKTILAESGTTSESDFKIIHSGNTITYELGGDSKYIYNYDGKNNPCKNILGLQDINNAQNLLNYYYVNTSSQITLNDNSYIYNDKNYPISATIKVGNFDNSVKTYQYQYFYE